MILRDYIVKYNDGGKTDGKKRRQQAYNFLVEKKGYTPEHALGIIGNLMVESFSDLRTKASGDNGTAYGIAQWRGDRLKKLKEIRSKDWNTLEGQLEFLDWELKNTEKKAYSKLISSSTPQEAALSFSKWYERPNAKYAHNNKRVSNALTLGQEVGYFSDTQAFNNNPTKKTVNERAMAEVVKDNTAVKFDKFPKELIPPKESGEPVHGININPEDMDVLSYFKFDSPTNVEAQQEEKKLEELRTRATSVDQEDDIDSSMEYYQNLLNFNPYDYIDIETY
ncbi:MAG: hypothetical protein KDH96_06780 [Candidatus Riesia sp.]|nr:hypothetical protein [Candidatus Riesia sp.]